MERGRPALLLVVVFVSGAAVLVLELAAARLFAPWFGTSLPVWTNVLAVVLGALAAGYALGGRMAARGPSLRTLGALLLAAGVLSGVAALAGPPLARSLLPEAADLEGLTGVLVRGSLLATLVVFGPPMVLLGAVGPLAVHLLAEGRPAGRAAGWVLALSTVGSIAGTFLTTHHLLPGPGTRATVAGAGAVLALAGLLLVLAGGGAPRARAAAAILVLASGAAAATAPSGEFRPAAPGTGRVLAERDTAYQFLQVREVPDAGAGGTEVPTRLLTMNEGVLTYHSVAKPGSVLTGGRYYDLYPAIPLLVPPDAGRPLEVLVLGFAAGTQARAMHHFHGGGRGLRLDGVEIDPEAVEMGHRWFDLPRDAPWLRVLSMDARAFLEAAPADRLYDVVLVDCYGQEYYIPFHTATEEFFARVRDRLRPGGVLAYNAFAYRPDDDLLRALVNTTATVFGRAFRTEVPGYPNFVVLASRRATDLPLLSLADALEAAGEPGSGGPLAAFAAHPEAGSVIRLAAPCLRAARAVDPDPALPVLRDDCAPVERLTDRAIRDYEATRAGRRP
jgi:spermidine synthase